MIGTVLTGTIDEAGEEPRVGNSAQVESSFCPRQMLVDVGGGVAGGLVQVSFHSLRFFQINGKQGHPLKRRIRQ